MKKIKLFLWPMLVLMVCYIIYLFLTFTLFDESRIYLDTVCNYKTNYSVAFFDLKNNTIQVELRDDKTSTMKPLTQIEGFNTLNFANITENNTLIFSLSDSLNNKQVDTFVYRLPHKY